MTGTGLRGPSPGRPPVRPPVIVLGGFLGSGKTTLLNHLLRSERMANTAVVINEFGDVAIDDDLVRHRGETVVELAGGCVCCAMQGTLAETLLLLIEAASTPIDRVLVETTGLANVGPIAHNLMADDDLAARFRFDRVITTVDAVNGQASLDRHPESVEQVAVADALVLTKRDLADPTTVEPLEARLRRLNPLAPIVMTDRRTVDGRADYGVVDVDALLAPVDLRRLLAADAAEPQSRTPAHDAHIRTVTVRRSTPLSTDELAQMWSAVGEHTGPNLLRVKGLVAIDGHPGPALVQGAQETLHDIEHLSDWPSDDRTSRLVFIGWDLDPDGLEALVPGQPI